MGKETKIGLAVIGILLVTFGVVLAKRLTMPSDSPLVLVDGDQPAIESATGGAGKDDVRAAARKPKAPEKTTVMAAKAVPPGGAGKQAPLDLGQWAAVCKKEDAPARPDFAAKSPPPPLMPRSDVVAVVRDAFPKAGPSADPKPGRIQPLGSEDSAPKAVGRDPFRAAAAPMAPVSYPLTAPPQDGRYAQYDSARRQPAAYVDDSRDWRQTAPPAKPIAAYAPRRTSGSATAASGRTVRDAEGNYVVQPNDSYWTISEKVYGAGGYFRALAEWNSRLVPNADKLNVGDAIRTPKREDLEKSYPDLCPDPKRLQAARGRLTPVSASASYSSGRTYVVEAGDTLYDIARYELGAASRWAEIYELNRNQLGEDFNYLAPGAKLILPEDGERGNFTRRPGDSVSR